MTLLAEPSSPGRPTDSDWSDWRWQQRNAVRTGAALRAMFPGVPEEVVAAVDAFRVKHRFQVTPYYLGLVHRTPDGLAPDPADPLWQQVLPLSSSAAEVSSYTYDGSTENWELPAEMVTPIAQRKYDDRVIVRLANICHSYCQFCYEALRTLEKESDKPSFRAAYWADTVRFVREHPEIEEVILSGGEPLIHTDETLNEVLGSLRAIDRPLAVRIHTRALTFNPFRITDELVDVLTRHRLTSMGLHVTHPRELTTEFAAAASRLQTAVPILFANIPLLRGVNDDVDTIRELGMSLYRLGVSRGYLYHFMPHSPAADRFRTSVQRGIDIVRALKRRSCNLAVPEFVLPHHTGKHTMPLLGEHERAPIRGHDEAGEDVIFYTNWRGELVAYPDPPLVQRTGSP